MNDLTRQASLEYLSEYIGIPQPPAKGDFRVWATRLFEFQFAVGGNDKAL